MDHSAKALVTVVIPAYLKSAQDISWLEEAFESVLAQTVPCKVIIVENGSNYFADLSGRVSIMHSKKGLSAARNVGIRACDTEFFFPLDCNDWLPDNALEILIRKYPGSGFVYGSTMLFRHERGENDQHLYDAKPYDFQECMKMVYWPNGALQKTADFATIGGYREDLPFLEDWDYWMTAGEHGICGTAIPDVTYWYRQHAGMVVSNKNSAQWEQVKRLIQSFHKEIYKGRYPEMCCGNKENRVPFVAPVQGELQPGADGMILIEYIGGNAGTMTFYGPVSGIRYQAGGVTKKLYIDQRDAITGIKKQPGFLEMQDHGNALFQQVAEEEPEPA